MIQTQKILKVGNSLAITLPKELISAHKLTAGQQVFVDSDPTVDFIQIRTTQEQSGLTPEFKEWLDKTTKKYHDVIQELAKK